MTIRSVRGRMLVVDGKVSRDTAAFDRRVGGHRHPDAADRRPRQGHRHDPLRGRRPDAATRPCTHRAERLRACRDPGDRRIGGAGRPRRHRGPPCGRSADRRDRRRSPVGAARTGRGGLRRTAGRPRRRRDGVDRRGRGRARGRRRATASGGRRSGGRRQRRAARDVPSRRDHERLQRGAVGPRGCRRRDRGERRRGPGVIPVAMGVSGLPRAARRHRLDGSGRHVDGPQRDPGYVLHPRRTGGDLRPADLEGARHPGPGRRRFRIQTAAPGTPGRGRGAGRGTTGPPGDDAPRGRCGHESGAGPDRRSPPRRDDGRDAHRPGGARDLRRGRLHGRTPGNGSRRRS